MNNFIIQSELSWFTNPTTNARQRGLFIRKPNIAYYHSNYFGGGGRWQIQGTIENIICTLKNDITPYAPEVLQNTSQQLADILSEDLPQIIQVEKRKLTVCVIPRAKVNYNADQLKFKATVSDVANRLTGFYNGTNYIVRHTDTKTTHRARSGHGGSGNMPYPGITEKTCSISDKVRGKDILLIDDLYTKSVNIDEDAIQSLLDKGAKSVVFYAVGKTI